MKESMKKSKRLFAINMDNSLSEKLIKFANDNYMTYTAAVVFILHKFFKELDGE